MPIQVKLYGNLREKVKVVDLKKGIPGTFKIEEEEVHFVYEILEKFMINEDEVSHIFVNGRYCGIGKKIKNSDRVGVFPKNMALMFAEIPDLNNIYVNVKLFAILRKYGLPKFSIEIPEGSTIRTVVKKLNFPKEEKNFIFMVNGTPKFDQNYIVENEDILAIFPPLGGG